MTAAIRIARMGVQVVFCQQGVADKGSEDIDISVGKIHQL